MSVEMQEYYGKLVTIFIAIFFVTQIKAYAISNDSTDQKVESTFSKSLDIKEGNNEYLEVHKIREVIFRGESYHGDINGVVCTVYDSTKKSIISWIRGDEVENMITKLRNMQISLLLLMSTNESIIRYDNWSADDKNTIVSIILTEKCNKRQWDYTTLSETKYVIDCAPGADVVKYTCFPIFNKNENYTDVSYAHDDLTSRRNCAKYSAINSENMRAVQSKIGNDVTLQCGVQGVSPITWVALKDGESYIPLIGGRFQVQDNILRINSVEYDDMGHYICSGQTNNGEHVNSTIFLVPLL